MGRKEAREEGETEKGETEKGEIGQFW